MHTLIPLFDDRSHYQVNRIMGAALCCPKCGAPQGFLIAMTEGRVDKPRYVVSCTECKFTGPFGRGLEDAVLLWNKPPSILTRILKKLGAS